MPENDLELEATVCMAVEHLPHPPVPGSVRSTCAECLTPVWMAPATRASIRLGHYPDYVLCLGCATVIEDRWGCHDE